MTSAITSATASAGAPPAPVLHVPGYYAAFRCLAGACPHTCCALWEIPVPPAYAAFAQSAPGPLGARLRAALAPEPGGAQGAVCLSLAGGTCPLLDEAGLCSLQRAWGEEALPPLCREHPRFSYDYGPVREVGLCASCPEAARLILSQDFTLAVRPLPRGEAAGEAPDPLLAPLLQARETALALLAAPGVPLGSRLQTMLLFANEAQALSDAGDFTPLPRLRRLYEQALPLPDPASLPERGAALGRVLEALSALEVLQPDWPPLLDAALARLSAGKTPPPPPQAQGARAAAYLLYRHWLRALNDGDLLTWGELAVVGTAVSGALASPEGGGFPGALRRFCLEVEHSQDNLDALQRALWERLTLPDLLALAGAD